MEKQEIVFEDLHGSPELSDVVVDLDVEDNAKGITRVAEDEPERKRGEAKAEREDGDGGEDDERPIVGRGEDEDDDSAYSKNVRKRIERERKLRLKEKEDAQFWREQAEEAQRQLAEARKSVTKESLEAIDSQIEAAEKELVDAIENGKSADQVRLSSKVTDLKARRIIAEQGVNDDGGSDKGRESGKVRPSGGVNPLARRWMGEQSDWYGKPGFERQSRLANRLDREIFDEGYDVNDPEYYEELTRRLRKQAPDLFDDGDLRGARRERGHSPVAPADRGGSERPAGRSSRVELGKEDFANMKFFGLDPNNPAHLKEYAANKREADAQERQRQGGRS